MEQSVNWEDIAFPILSFLLTIVGPAVVALWVIMRTARDMRSGGADSDKPASASKR